MTDLEIAKTLKGAAQYIRDHGWCQRALGGPEGPVCAAGAILYTDAGMVVAQDAVETVLGASGFRSENGLRPLAVWNDTPGRTAAQVTDLFESVALQHELRALAVTTLSQDAATAVCDNTVPEAVNA